MSDCVSIVVGKLSVTYLMQVECIIFCCIETTNGSAPIHALTYRHTHTLKLFELQSIEATCKRRSCEITQVMNVHTM